MTDDWLEWIAYDSREQEPHAKPHRPVTLAALATYLMQPARLEWFRKNDLALSFHDEIKVAVDRVRLVVDRPQDREVDVVLGECGDVGCIGTIIATLPPEGEGETSVRCTGCAQTWTGAQYRKLGRFVEPVEATRPLWVSVPVAASMLGVTTRKIRHLIAQGHIREERFSPRKRRIRADDVANVRDFGTTRV
jgi:excisionase family DNA binding protein